MSTGPITDGTWSRMSWSARQSVLRQMTATRDALRAELAELEDEARELREQITHLTATRDAMRATLEPKAGTVALTAAHTLAALPPDPDAELHRAHLLAALNGRAE